MGFFDLKPPKGLSYTPALERFKSIHWNKMGKAGFNQPANRIWNLLLSAGRSRVKKRVL